MAMLRKIVALAMLIMFVMSIVPLVVAEKNAEREVKSEKQEIRSKDRLLVGDSGENSEDTEERTADRSKGKSRNVFSQEPATSATKSRVKGLKELNTQYLQVKEKYIQAKKDYNTEKEKFKAVKEKVKKCTDDSVDCKSKKEELKKGVAQHLLKTNELIVRSLEKLTDRVQNSNALTEEQRMEALASITELETSLTAEKDRVTALAETATNAELRESIKSLKHLWQEVRTEQRKIVSLMVSSKLENMSEKLSQFGASMQQSIDRLKAEGQDTTELEALYVEFIAKVETLKTAPATEAAALLQEAKELLRQFKAAEEALKESSAENETEEETDDDVNETETGEDLNETEETSETDESTNESTENSTEEDEPLINTSTEATVTE